MSTAPTAMYSPLMSEPESLTSSESSLKKQPPQLTIQYPKSSEKPLRSTSKLSKFEKLFQQQKGKPTNEFIDYLDQHVRRMMIQDIQTQNRRISNLDTEAVWQDLVICAWRNGITADDFEDSTNLLPWAYSQMRKYIVWQNETFAVYGANKSTKSDYMFHTYHMSDIADDLLTQTIIRNSQAKYSSPTAKSLSPSMGWLQEALDKMTDRQKDAIFLIKVVGLSFKDTAEEMNSTVTAVRSVSKVARKRILKYSPEEWEPLYG